jgi:hypothetical protein
MPRVMEEIVGDPRSGNDPHGAAIAGGTGEQLSLKRRLIMIEQGRTRPSPTAAGRVALVALTLALLPVRPQMAAGPPDGDPPRRDPPAREVKPDDGASPPRREGLGVGRDAPTGGREVAKSRRIVGTLTAVDGANLMLVIGEAGRKAVVNTDDKTEFFVDRKKAGLAELKQGMVLTITQVEGLTTRVEVGSSRRINAGGARDGGMQQGDRPRDVGAKDRPPAQGDGQKPRDGALPGKGNGMRDGGAKGVDRPRDPVVREGGGQPKARD